MTDFTQENRLIAVASPLGEDVLLLESFRGREELSQPFDFRLGLLSERHDIAPDEIVGQNVAFVLRLPEDSVRHYNGYVRRFSAGPLEAAQLRRYWADVSPWLWFLTRTTDCRIFQSKTAPEILEEIFNDLNFRDFDTSGLQNDYRTWDYCVQYDESDFNFVSRLMEQEGIFYYWRHEDGKHTLMLADHKGAYKDCPENEIEYVPGSLAVDHIERWEHHYEFRAGAWAQNDFNFETPRANLQARTETLVDLPFVEDYELYHYPGEHKTAEDGTRLSRLRMEEEEVPYDQVYATSTCRTLFAGGKFTLTRHDCPEEEGKSYLITAIHHEAHDGTYIHGDAASAEYANTFTCMPATSTFRPARVTPKPVIRGLQTAIVVGPSGEEIHTDDYGRIKVQFHWDRRGEGDESSSCWIRVAQPWAGKKWGASFLPRVGHEVVVAFIEGDPDRPMVIGSVYNASEMPPYPPGERTKSTVKSLSSKGGGGFNELRFEDKKGDEQVFLHGEKDLDVRIKNDRREWIGNDRHLVVKRDKCEQIERDHHAIVDRDVKTHVKRDHHLKIDGKQAVKVGNSLSLTVQQDVNESFNMNHSEQVSLNYYLKAGVQVVIEAAAGLTIKCGGSFVTLNPAGVQISGPTVLINSGGAALSGSAGSAVSPAAPLEAEIADQAEPGSRAESYRQQREEMAPAEREAINAPWHREDEESEERSWIEIELIDEDGNPVPGERYRITLPDGTTLAEGTLDQNGFARVDGIDPGTCQVTFPDLDSSAWEPA